MSRLLAIGLALVALGPVRCAEHEEPAPPWLFVCVLSYDNDLEIHAATILERLREGVRDTDHVVTVLADFRGPGGLRRFEIDRNGSRYATLPTDDSASEAVLADYLAWAAEAYPDRRTAIVFLDHGGGLDDMCQDLSPPGGPEGRWLSARKVGPLLRDFRARPGREVEMLFLQQCGRGSVECLYNFKGTARAVVASQTRVGAPNTYYTPVLRWLAANPEVDGFRLAERILREDEDFHTYACLDGDAIADLPLRVDAVVLEILAKRPGPLVEPQEAAYCYSGWFRKDEEFYDLLDWFTALYEVNGLAPEDSRALSDLRSFMNDRLIRHHRHHGRTVHLTRSWNGLAVLVPRSPPVLARYRDYPFYEDSRLDDLWVRLY